MATAMELAMAQMQADLGKDRRIEIATPNADAKGQKLSRADDIARERKIQQHLREREQKLDALRDSPDGQAIKGWIALSATKEGNTKDPDNRWSGQGHRVNIRGEDDDAEYGQNVLRYGEERAIYMSQKKTTIPQRQEQSVAEPSTSRAHRRAEDPAKQGTVLFVKGKAVAVGSGISPPKAPNHMLISAEAPQSTHNLPAAAQHGRSQSNRTAVRSNGPVEVQGSRRTHLSGLPLPSKPGPSPSQVKVFVTNKAVESGLLPSELLQKLLASMQSSKKARKSTAFIEPTTSASAVPIVYMSSILSDSTAFNVVEDVDMSATWPTMSMLKTECEGLEHRQLQAIVSFLFDIHRQEWLEQNPELIKAWNYVGMRIRQEMMILAQLPESHERVTHLLNKFGFILQLQEHMLAARAAIAAIETEDDDARKWFKINTQYQAFYNIAAGLVKETTHTQETPANGVVAESAGQVVISTSTADRDVFTVAAHAAIAQSTSVDTKASSDMYANDMETVATARANGPAQDLVKPVHSMHKSKWAPQPLESSSTIPSTASSAASGPPPLFLAATVDAGSMPAPRVVAETPIKSALLMSQNSAAIKVALTQHADRVKKNGIWYPRSVLAEK